MVSLQENMFDTANQIELQLYRQNNNMNQNKLDENQFIHFNRNRQAVAKWLQQIHSQCYKNHHISSLSPQLHRSASQKRQAQSFSQIDPVNVSVYIYQFLVETHRKIPFPYKTNTFSDPSFNEGQHLQIQQQSRLQQLQQKNQHFMQSLKDYSQNIICYAYAPSNNWEVNLPKCLIGYYELVKNLVFISSYLSKNQIKNQSQLMRESKTKIKQSRKHSANNGMENNKKIPVQLQAYSQENLLRILLCHSPFSYIYQNLAKLQDTILTQTFKRELENLIIKRFCYLCQLFSLEINESDLSSIGEYFMSNLFDKMNGVGENGQETLQISMDLIILCIIYAVYRTRRYLILFAHIIDLYEKKTQNKVNKQQLLQFYNNIFLVRLEPNLILSKIRIEESETNNEGKNSNRLINFQKEAVMLIKNQKIDEQDHNMSNSGLKGSHIFRCEQLKQQKSIYDMFQ